MSITVSAVLVTRGDVDLTPILDSIHAAGVREIVIWDNSKRRDFKVYGRYRGAFEAHRVEEPRHPVIYTQDDDCLVDVAAVLAAYQPGRVVCNMPLAKRSEYAAIAPRIALVGWGACFDENLIHALGRYTRRFGADELLLRECDRVFTALNPTTLIDVPVRHLPHAFVGRMGNETRHLGDLAEIQRRIAALSESQ